jgi:hypothetical protein
MSLHCSPKSHGLCKYKLSDSYLFLRLNLCTQYSLKLAVTVFGSYVHFVRPQRSHKYTLKHKLTHATHDSLDVLSLYRSGFPQLLESFFSEGTCLYDKAVFQVHNVDRSVLNDHVRSCELRVL